jgi:hypothetical protein
VSIEDIFDVGRQDSDEAGQYVYPEGLCVACGCAATKGSWCGRHHPTEVAPRPPPRRMPDTGEVLAIVDAMLLEPCTLSCGLCGRVLDPAVGFPPECVGCTR